jgi:sialic acid synthase SpsE
VKLAFVVTGNHTKLLTEAPKTQKANAKLPMYPDSFGARKLSLHRIANVRGYVFKVGSSVLVQPHTITVVADFQDDLIVCFSANDHDVFSSSINRILDQLADGFKRVRL